MSSREVAVAPPRNLRRVLSTATARIIAHPAGPLVAIMAIAGLGWSQYTAATRGWSVMTDELQYVELALSIGDNLSLVPTVNDAAHGSYNQLYPLLLAPFYALFDMDAAFRASHFVNTVLMVSAAIPTYLLARDIGSSRFAAYLAAALTVVAPWLVLATMTLTENAAYPAFLWGVLGVERALARPSPRWDVTAIAAIVLAFSARTQLVVLGLVLPAAVVLHEAGFAAGRAAAGSHLAAASGAVRRLLREHRALWIGYGVVCLAAAAIALPKGSFAEILGSYAETTEGDLVPPGTLEWMARHVAVIAVAMGVIPFVLAVAWMLTALLRPSSSKAAHAFAVVLLLLLVVMTFQATSFTLRYAGEAVQDRYLFYVVPLLFVGMAGALGDRRLPLLALAAAAGLFALVAWQPEYTPGTAAPLFNSPAGVFHSVLDGRTWEIGYKLGIADLSATPVIALGGVAAALAAGLAIRRLPPVWAVGTIGFGLLAFCVAETRYVFGAANGVQAGSAAGTVHRDWVDRALPDGQSAAVVFTPILPGSFAGSGIWWNTMFFNRSVDRELRYDDGRTSFPSQTPFHAHVLKVDFESGLIDHQGVERDYLLFARRDPTLKFRPKGRPVAAIEAGLTLMRLAQPWRAQWATREVDNEGRISDSARLRVFGDGEKVQVRFELFLPSEAPRPHRYRVTADGRVVKGTLRPNEARRLTLAVCVPPKGSADVRFRTFDRMTLPNREKPTAKLGAVTTTTLSRDCPRGRGVPSVAARSARSGQMLAGR